MTKLVDNQSRPVPIVVGFWVIVVLSILGIGLGLYLVYVKEVFSGNDAFSLVYWSAKWALAILVWLRFGWARWGLLFIQISTPIGATIIQSMRDNEASFIALLMESTAGNWVFWLQAVALALLFLPASNRWLKGERYVVT